MSRTYRLFYYRKGRPIYTRNEGNSCTYHFYRHEFARVRRQLHRNYRHKAKIYLRKFGYVPVRFKTNGWETW